MKKNESTKPQNSKKEKEKGKNKPKENPKESIKQVKVQESDSEDSYYTPEEIVLLDKFHDFTNHKFEDEEIYDIMVKFNNNEDLIKNELNEMLKVFKRGVEFSWTEIGKSN